MELNWESLLEAKSDYTDEDLKEELSIISNEGNIEKKQELLSYQAAEFTHKEKLEKKLFLEKLNQNFNSRIDYSNYKFPQANNINLSFLILEFLLENNTNNYQYITNLELSLAMGFSSRQGNYYGDLLHYLGFLNKSISGYSPNEKMFDYKQVDQQMRLKMFVYSFLEHETFIKCFKNYYNSETNQILDYAKILRNDPLLLDFKESTVLRRASTVKAIIRWVDQYLG